MKTSRSQPVTATADAATSGAEPSAVCPVIIVYAQHSTSREAPEPMRYAAAMVPRIVPKRGKIPAHTEPGTSWLATGPTPEAARAKLEAVWLKQFPPISEKELARRAAAGRSRSLQNAQTNEAAREDASPQGSPGGQ